MTKNSVLKILSSSDGYVSGEEISKRINVSRAAVNAAVKKLRRDGYDILSATNKGYFLKSTPDIIAAETLAQYLPHSRCEKVLCLSSVDSTNKKAASLAYDGSEDGTVVIANRQTSGRGRMGRSFFSPGDKGIYLSILFKPQGEISELAGITAAAAVAVCRASKTVYGKLPDIKWVNDLLINGRKVCGILTEAALEGESGRIKYIIIGIGINVLGEEKDFPEEIRHTATSFEREYGTPVPRAEFAAEIIKELDKLDFTSADNKKKILSDYRRLCTTIGKDVGFLINSTEYRGVAAEINEDFSLKVRLSDGGFKDLKSGEISLLKK